MTKYIKIWRLIRWSLKIKTCFLDLPYFLTPNCLDQDIIKSGKQGQVRIPRLYLPLPDLPGYGQVFYLRG